MPLKRYSIHRSEKRPTVALISCGANVALTPAGGRLSPVPRSDSAPAAAYPSTDFGGTQVSNLLIRSIPIGKSST